MEATQQLRQAIAIDLEDQEEVVLVSTHTIPTRSGNQPTVGAQNQKELPNMAENEGLPRLADDDDMLPDNNEGLSIIPGENQPMNAQNQEEVPAIARDDDLPNLADDNDGLPTLSNHNEELPFLPGDGDVIYTKEVDAQEVELMDSQSGSENSLAANEGEYDWPDWSDSEEEKER